MELWSVLIRSRTRYYTEQDTATCSQELYQLETCHERSACDDRYDLFTLVTFENSIQLLLTETIVTLLYDIYLYMFILSLIVT